jgi:carboxypeptidase Taq
VEADEVTYNLHILLRLDLERALIGGNLNPADLPGAWNEGFERYLGLQVDEDRNGCLQDVHWSAGVFGYFPTYTLGNLYAGQFFDKATAGIPDFQDRLGKGDLSTLHDWLKQNIFSHGLRYRAKELCEQVTGSPLTADSLMTYLIGKFKDIYGF